MNLPYLTPTVAPIDAVFRETWEDFEVEEVPAYPPLGSGEHVLVHIEKRGITTQAAVAALCERTGADPKSAGWAGLKDKAGVTRQWVSLWGTTPDVVRGASTEDVRVLEAASHPHKLRTGHLRANRFRVRLRGIDPARLEDVHAVLDAIEARGLPNFYGEQRFGREGDNAQRALRWVRGASRAPKSPFHRKLQMSALQSKIFNRAVAARLEGPGLGAILAGDLVKKHDSGGLFVAEDLEEAQARADAWEISPTGPIFGAKMRWPQGAAKAAEEALLEEMGLTPADFARWKRLAPGTRRFIRVPVPKIARTVVHDTIELDFALPAGSYATILIREIRKRDASAPQTS